VTVLHLPPRERLAETLERARKLHKVHIVTPSQQPLDSETWAQRNMDAALAAYREIFGVAALQVRLQRSLDEASQP
jgi:hypothetical protein